MIVINLPNMVFFHCVLVLILPIIECEKTMLSFQNVDSMPIIIFTCPILHSVSAKIRRCHGYCRWKVNQKKLVIRGSTKATASQKIIAIHITDSDFFQESVSGLK